MNRILISCLVVLSLVISAGSGVCEVGKKLHTLTQSSQGGVVEGRDGWLFLHEELEHMAAGQFWGDRAAAASKVSKKEFADPLPAIVDFRNQLSELGIELIFAPIPPKALIYNEKLPIDLAEQDVQQLEKTYQDFYRLLGEQGVTVLDLIPVFNQEKKQKQLYCTTDTHYSGDGVKIVAKHLAEKIDSLLPATDGEGPYTVEPREVTILGDLASMTNPQKAQEQLQLYFVKDSSTGSIAKANDDSSVLVLGDSHTLVFSAGGDMHAKGAGLAENLSAGLGDAVGLLGVRGSGATPARIKLYQKVKRDQSYLANKKVIVWSLAAREFTGTGGWRKVPVVPKKK